MEPCARPAESRLTMPRRPCIRDPIGLNREDAARYIGVSPGMFDAMVQDGRMPRARMAGARKIWHAGELETALLALPVSGENGDNTIQDSDRWGAFSA